MKDSSHIEKIRKLLRLAGSSNCHEAELAMQRALELAARHAVDIHALMDAGEANGTAYRWIPCGLRVSREERLAKGVARRFFQVTTCMSRRSYLLIGEESAMEVALYVIGFLVTTSRRLLADYKKQEQASRRKLTTSKRASFIDGFFHGIGHQLDTHQQKLLTEYASLAIVLTDGAAARAKTMNNLVGETTAIAPLARPRRNPSAIMAGFDAGLNTSIRPALKASDAPLALN